MQRATTLCSHICTETRFLSHCAAQDTEFLSLFYIPERSTNGQVAADHGIVGNNIWALPVAATSGPVPDCRYLCHHWCFGLVLCTYHVWVHVCLCMWWCGVVVVEFFCKDCSCRLCSIGKLCIVSNEVEKAFGLQKEGGESQGCLIYLTLAHHVCILQFWMQVLAMEWIVSKDSVLYCQITPTLPTFCLHTSASAILDGQLWSHWLQDCHFYLLCHAQSPIVSSFFSLNWKFCRLSPFMTKRLGFADVFCNLLACLSNNNLRYKAKLFDLYKSMGLWGKKTFKYTTTLVF